MARNTGSVIQNNLSRGLITEATGLNFPENAVTEAWNVVFERTGRVRRRQGFDIESSGESQGAYNPEDGVINEYVWQTVSLNNEATFLVLQWGNAVYFYELKTADGFSVGASPGTINLSSFQAPGASQIQDTPCSFTSGMGYLFIAHPQCDPILVKYIPDDQTLEASRITLEVRDFEGLEDGLEVSTEPGSLSTEHHYNLKNQGWYKSVPLGANNNEV